MNTDVHSILHHLSQDTPDSLDCKTRHASAFEGILSYVVPAIHFQWITSCHKNRMTTRVKTLWRVLACDQWWSFAFCTSNYVFIASQIRQFSKRKQSNPYKKDSKILCLSGKKLTIFPSHPHANIAEFLGDYSPPDIYY